MTDPRWGEAFGYAASRLADYWPDKLAIGAAFTGLCACWAWTRPGYLCFAMLTLDMTTRVAVHCKRNRPLCRGLKRGIPRYICYLLFILLAWAVQFAVERALGARLPVVDLIMAYLVLTDCASVIGICITWACPCRVYSKLWCWADGARLSIRSKTLPKREMTLGRGANHGP